MLYAYSVKNPIGELNLKRPLDEDTEVFSSFFHLLLHSRFWEFHPSLVILGVFVFSLSWSSVNPWFSMLNLGALYTLFWRQKLNNVLTKTYDEM